MFEKLGGFFGGGNKEKKQEIRPNAGGKFMTVPENGSETTEDEALAAGIIREDLETWQTRAGELETEIMNLRNQPDGPEKEAQLSELNTKLREINSKIAELNPPQY